MTENESSNHPSRCDNGCIRRMDIERTGKGNFSYHKGTMDCPAQLDLSGRWAEEVSTISVCGCCSFDDGTTVKSPDDCRYRKGEGSWSECDCHNTPILYTTCLSKRNHGCCPYGLKAGDDE